MKKLIALFLTVFVFCMHPVFAEVITTQTTEGYGSYVYVAGSPEQYPIEYYDAQAKAYKGIVPALLEKISERTGINFVYINGNKANKNELGESLQAEIVSSVTENARAGYIKDYVELVSYKQDGKTQTYGLAFTTIANDAQLAEIKAAAAALTVEEKNGVYLSYATTQKKTNYFWLFGSIALALLLVVLILILQHRIKQLREKSEVDRLTDMETGLGNMQFFKHHFKSSISDVSRSLYYISYIILDSSYLRSYHGDSSFEEVLKLTASVLSDAAGDREIPARITENGFAFAFQSPNDDDAKLRLTEILDKLNDFKDVSDESTKLVFHAAMYHLAPADKNCEILLFNLRKNCNKIFGTDEQLICCDIYAMNKIQQEKKITESILDGFEKNEFKMYLQFIVDSKTQKIVSAEALSRWDSPTEGLLGPGRYIENMEMAGMIGRHDFYMLDLACRQLEKWKGTPFESLTISCNFTRITLSEDNFYEKIKLIANGYDIDKSKIAIEITEDSMERDREVAMENVAHCKALGFRVYLDDLGSGYTTLSNLCDYPIDVVKIDRDILLKTENPKGKELFEGIIALAHSLNIQVICEGVETPEQVALVRGSDCDFIQGWHYSKPLPLEECESFILNFNK